MLTVTGPAGLAAAEAHRRIRHDLGPVLPRMADLDASSPRRIERLRTDLLELLEDVVVPLADVEEVVVDLASAPHHSHQVRSGGGRAAHDVVRELTSTLRHTPPGDDADDRVLGALQALHDLLPAHLDGEEEQLLTDLAALTPTQREELRGATDRLPRRPRASEVALARFHLPLPHATTVERLTDPAQRTCFLPAVGTTPPPTLRWPQPGAARVQHTVPIAVISGPDGLALRFALRAQNDDQPVTLAYIDGWIEPTNGGRNSILTLDATPPIHPPTGLPATDLEVRRAVAWLGSVLASGLGREVRAAT